MRLLTVSNEMATGKGKGLELDLDDVPKIKGESYSPWFSHTFRLKIKGTLTRVVYRWWIYTPRFIHVLKKKKKNGQMMLIFACILHLQSRIHAGLGLGLNLIIDFIVHGKARENLSHVLVWSQIRLYCRINL